MTSWVVVRKIEAHSTWTTICNVRIVALTVCHIYVSFDCPMTTEMRAEDAVCGINFHLIQAKVHWLRCTRSKASHCIALKFNCRFLRKWESKSCGTVCIALLWAMAINTIFPAMKKRSAFRWRYLFSSKHILYFLFIRFDVQPARKHTLMLCRGTESYTMMSSFSSCFETLFFCRSTSYMAHGAPLVLMHMYTVICTHSYVIHPFRISHSKYTEHKCEFEVLGHGRGSASVFIHSNIHLFWCWIWSRNPDIYM